MPVNDLILIRAGTSAQWSGVNPILQTAEPGLDTTLGRIKYGDGVSSWNNLQWSGPVGISGLNIAPLSGLFTNTSGIAGNALLHAYSSTSGATIFNVEGTNGSLFSVTDNLSGSLMSVNNNAGLPIFEVFSDDRVIAGRFNQNDLVIASGGQVGIGVYNSGTQKLYVVGASTLSGLLTANSGNFINSLVVNNTGVSLSGHSHTISDITNFNSSVSGLLAPYALLSSGNFSTLYVTGIPVSTSGHVHTSSQITDFNTSVNSLISVKNINGSGYVSVNATTGNYIISVTGLQPSGNYSLVGHSHLVSDISNFASGVSGLLPITGLVGGYGINVSGDNRLYTISSSLTTIDEANSLVTVVFNESASPIPKFTAVYISGGHGDMPVASLAIANTESKSSKTYGITQEAIPSMGSGHVVSFGNITGLNTDVFNPSAPVGDVNGQVLYLSPTVSGGLTTDKPYAPNHLVALGTIIRTHQTQGVFNVRVQNGFELEELHNVAITGVASGQFLKYNGSVWRNSGITSSDISDFTSAVSGISPNISISGTSGISVDKNGNNYLVYTTGNFGLTQSQIQSLLNSGVSINITSGTGIFDTLSTQSINGNCSIDPTQINIADNYVNNLNLSPTQIYMSDDPGNYISITTGGISRNGISVSYSGHTHISSQITDFNSATSGLLTPYALLSSGNFNNLFVSGVPVSLSGHKHTVSDITNFASSVSGLLPNINRQYEIVSSGKSTFSVTGGYSSGNLDVFQNGVKLLLSQDFTATNGSTFSLISPAVSGDVVEWISFNTMPKYQVLLGEVRSDYVGTTNYIGTAVAGSSEASGVWRIKKNVIADNGVDITTTTATNAAWTNRLVATYV